MSDLIERARGLRVSKMDPEEAGKVLADIVWELSDALEAQAQRIADLDKRLDKIHALAIGRWGDRTGDGWLRIMQIADPSTRAALKGEQ